MIHGPPFKTIQILWDLLFSYVTFKGETRLCWTSYEKGWVLGAFFYGYIIPMIPGGALSERIGSKFVSRKV